MALGLSGNFLMTVPGGQPAVRFENTGLGALQASEHYYGLVLAKHPDPDLAQPNQLC